MVTFRRITKRDDPKTIAATAVRYQTLLTDALAMAQQKAKRKPRVVREILATGTAEGLNGHRDAKYAVVTYRAEKYKRTWLSLIGWQYLKGSRAEHWADSMVDTVETNVRMTETNSWPKAATRPSRSKGKR
jgi:hypothetical protein